MQPENPRYNMASIVRLTGALDFSALTNALKTVAARHETLRTWFAMGDSEPMQVVEADAKVAIGRMELDTVTDAEREPTLQRAIQEEISRPFDLTTVPLIRCSLFKRGPNEHLLVTTMPHLISDEWSFRIFHHELFECYASTTSQLPLALPELPIQYGDYAEWQHGAVQRGRFQSELEYWKGQLKGNPVGVELPTDYPRHSPRGCKGGESWRELDVKLGSSLTTLARSEDVSLFMVLLAAFEALLFRYTRQEDLIVGTPVAGRNQVETENLIGCFVNTLALRNRLSGAMTFRELLAQVRETALGAYSNQEVPFERIVEALQPERVADRTPFINVMFFLQHEPGESLQVPGLKIEFLDPDTGPAKFDLTLFVRQTGSRLVAAAQYDAGLFAPETVGRFLEHYENLLRNVVARPHQCVSELPLSSEAERELILSEWSGTPTDYPRNATVHELFEEQVRLRPETIALKCGAKSLSYRALNAQANRVARDLQKCGVTPGALVGLCSERSLEMIVGMLGILKCGAAYAPLDFSLPRKRLAQMLTDLNPAVLVATHDRLLLPESALIPTLCLERSEQISVGESVADLPGQGRADGLAYVSFTSGSTGKAKGVLVPHRGIVRLVRNTNYVRFEPGDTFLQLAPLAFDASTFEIWGCLLNGGTLVIAPPELPSLSELAELMARHQVTTAWFTSGLFNQIVDEQPELLKPLRQVLTGGDVLSPLHVREALRVLGLNALINGYGPTENTTFSTCYHIPPDFDGKGAVPIGRPIANTTCYVLDERLQP
ncbi:MAG TPA: condensation domain-containing protein, partial [Verrucomicrobiae bacterium]|nr:condensation domain-containing protein [Verrucomicrobiae bacterium]